MPSHPASDLFVGLFCSGLMLLIAAVLKLYGLIGNRRRSRRVAWQADEWNRDQNVRRLAGEEYDRKMAAAAKATAADRKSKPAPDRDSLIKTGKRAIEI